MKVEIEIRLPEGIFREPAVLEFVKFLDEGGIKDEVRQRGIVEALLIERVRGIGERYVRAMGRQITEITHLRDVLRSRYRSVVEHFRSGKTAAQLSPELQPAAFDALYGQLASAVEGLETPASFVRKVPKTQLKASPPPVPPRAIARAAEDVGDSLRLLERRYRATMEAHPDGAAFANRVDAIRALLGRGEVEQARSQLDALNHDLDVARTTLENQGTPGLRDVAAEAEAERLSPYRRTPLQSIEGLREAPEDLIADGVPELPLDRIEINRQGFALVENQIELARILELAETPGKASEAGLRFEAFIKRLYPNEPAVLRAGRRPDLGASEITIEGRTVGFTPHKVGQLWVDLTDLTQIDLIVPRLSERAVLELRRIGGVAEARLGIRVRIRVLVVGP